MKKILMISAFPPCDKTAGQSYTNRLIHDLCKDHHVDLIYFSYQDHHFTIENDNLEVKKVLYTNSIVKFLSTLKLFFIFPFFSSRFRFRVLWYLLTKSKDYDCLYFDFSQVFIYSLFVNHSYKILMAHDVIIQKYHRLSLLLRRAVLLLLSLTEKVILRAKGNKVLVFSEKDQKVLKSVYKVDSRIVDFYVDQQIYNLNVKDFQYKFDFVLFAAWNRDVNIEGLTWFIDNVLYQIRISIDPNVSILIMGNGLPENIKKSLSLMKGVQVVGYVENPYPYIASCRCLIAPIFNGAGVKVKVLESAFCATNVLGTGIALEGISEELLVKCVKVLDAQDLINEMNQIMNLHYSAEEKYHEHLEILKIYPKKQFKDYFYQDLAARPRH